MLLPTVLSAALGTPAVAMPGPDATWEVLDNKPVLVECTDVAGTPWCRSTARMDAAPANLATALQAMDKQAEIFESVSSIRVLEHGTLHVTLDFPGLLSDRDYVAAYDHTNDGGNEVYSWTAVAHPDAPEVDGVVRLVDFAGAWTIAPDPMGSKVSYLWHAELGGSFPNWALPIARKKTGHEALKDLANAQGAKLTPPT